MQLILMMLLPIALYDMLNPDARLHEFCAMNETLKKLPGPEYTGSMPVGKDDLRSVYAYPGTVCSVSC